MNVEAQEPSRRTKCHHLYVSTYNCLVFAADRGEQATPMDRLQGNPSGLRRLLPLKGTAANLLFCRVFSKHIGCTPSPSDLPYLLSAEGHALRGLPRGFVTHCPARTFVSAQRPSAGIWIWDCGRRQATLTYVRFESSGSARLRRRNSDPRAV